MTEIKTTPNGLQALLGDFDQSSFVAPFYPPQQQSFFTFPELNVRVKGRYRLRIDVIDRSGLSFSVLGSFYTEIFEVHAKSTYPGLSPATDLVKAIARRGVKFKVAKEGGEGGSNAPSSANKRKRDDTGDAADSNWPGMDSSQALLASPASSSSTESWDSRRFSGPSSYYPTYAEPPRPRRSYSSVQPAQDGPARQDSARPPDSSFFYTTQGPPWAESRNLARNTEEYRYSGNASNGHIATNGISQPFIRRWSSWTNTASASSAALRSPGHHSMLPPPPQRPDTHHREERPQMEVQRPTRPNKSRSAGRNDGPTPSPWPLSAASSFTTASTSASPLYTSPMPSPSPYGYNQPFVASTPSKPFIPPIAITTTDDGLGQPLSQAHQHHHHHHQHLQHHNHNDSQHEQQPHRLTATSGRPSPYGRSASFTAAASSSTNGDANSYPTGDSCRPPSPQKLPSIHYIFEAADAGQRAHHLHQQQPQQHHRPSPAPARQPQPGATPRHPPSPSPTLSSQRARPGPYLGAYDPPHPAYGFQHQHQHPQQRH